ncbi:MAG: hypothetical protein AB7K64_16770 [Variibacter sp.]
MRFDETDLDAAVAAGALPAEGREPLVAFLRSRQPASSASFASRFDLAHLLWYAGALIVMTALGLFSTIAFSAIGGAGLAATAIVYALAFGAAGHFLWHRRKLTVPGGLLIAVAVAMVPLAVYGVQDALGAWPAETPVGTVRDFYIWVRAGWLPMELITIAAALIALYFYPFPFIVSIIAFALWFMSMDLAPALYGKALTWETRATVSLWFGLAVLVVAWAADLTRSGGRFAFWLHLFGLMAFWGGLSLMDSGSEFAKFGYCLINVVLLLLAVFLGRRAYAVFGAIGIAAYLGDLSARVFKDSALFPFALSLIGIAVIALGLLYYRKQAQITAWLETNLPPALRALRPVHAR